MQSILLAFSLGILAFASAHATPNLTAFGLFTAGVCLPAAVFGVRVSLIVAVIAGFGFGAYSNSEALAERVPVCSDSKYRSLTVQISDVPVIQANTALPREGSDNSAVRHRARFAARILEAVETDCHGLHERLVRLSWYEPPDLRRGDVWQVSAKIRPPWSYQNPGGFDFERWLLAKGLNGTGYIRTGTRVSREDAALLLGSQLQQRIRQWLLARETRHAGIIFALLTGDGSLIEAPVWQAFRDSGTIHLVVVSGLHVGIVAALALLLGQILARLFPVLLLWLGARRFATLFAVTGTAGYVAFTGFGLPGVRAWIMASVMLGALALGRRFPVALMFLIALTGILISDPLAVHQQGFWLSFTAVAGLLWFFQARANRLGRSGGLLLTQWVLLIVMPPLLASLNGAVPLISPVANLLVVPVISLVVLPLSFLTAAAIFLLPPLADLVIVPIEFLLDAVQIIISFCARMPQLHAAAISSTTLLFLTISCAALLAMPDARRILALLPVWLAWLASVDTAIPPGEFQLTVLDVGQGSAIIVDTARHRLLFDTAPKYPGGFDLGTVAVVPAILATGTAEVDRVVLSHDDSDHTGGFGAVHQAVKIGSTWVSQPAAADLPPHVERCRTGTGWRWDDVDFEFLHPPPGLDATDNEQSCVLLISNPRRRILLPGDIGRTTERRLLEERDLAVDLLLAPHHGSSTSSSPRWVQESDPQFVFVSAPRRSQYGHPQPAVVERYEKSGAQVFVTGLDGALRWRSWGDEPPMRWRYDRAAYWTNQLPERTLSRFSELPGERFTGNLPVVVVTESDFLEVPNIVHPAEIPVAAVGR